MQPLSSVPVSQRVVRLLSLYRIVGAIALLLVAIATETRMRVFGLAITGYVVLYIFGHAWVAFHSARVTEWPRLWLLVFLVLDVFSVLFLSRLDGTLLYFAGLLPVLVAHAWLLRDRHAYLHAAFVALAMLIGETLHSPTISQAAYLGAGGFAAAILGQLLGRFGFEAVELADQRAVDLEKLSTLNQRIIEDFDQGVLVVDRDGYILQANPQATRWLFGANDNPVFPQSLMLVSEGLGVYWQNWRDGNTLSEAAGVTLGSGETQVKVRPRIVAVELRRAGDTIVFLEDLAVAQTRAQQIKLAALGRLTANIAHEIRNPLSAIRQASQLLAEGETNPNSPNGKLTVMVEKNVRRIDRIVSNVLTLSKRDKVHAQNIELASALPELVAEWRNQTNAPADAVALSVDGAPQIRCDPGHFEEVLWNLMSNGWRHGSKRAGCLSVTARTGHSGRLVAVEVTDDGPGVASDHRESIFEPFFSMSGSSGLGLYISRELAESNGGTLELTSYNKGAQFRLILPGRDTTP